jgi:hypothetical protein
LTERFGFCAQFAESHADILPPLPPSRRDDFIGVVDLTATQSNRPRRPPHVVNIKSSIALVKVALPQTLVSENRFWDTGKKFGEPLVFAEVPIGEFVLNGVVTEPPSLLDALAARFQTVNAD